MIRTEQGAWWLTLFGTEPRRNRLAPVMPLLPTMMRPAFSSSATSRIASAGSPSRAKVLTATPASAMAAPARTSTTIATCIQIHDRGMPTRTLDVGCAGLLGLDVGHGQAEAARLARQVELEPPRDLRGQR